MTDSMLNTIIGAIIGFLSSILTVIIGRWIDRVGKLKIYIKIINSSNEHPGWGMMEGRQGKYFSVPVVYQIQNTSNTTRVIRDINVLLFDGNKFLRKMKQIEYMQHDHREGGQKISTDKEYFGVDAGSYSFIIPPRSINTFKCFYILNESQVACSAGKHFDNLKIRYFDERDKVRIFDARTISNVEVIQDADDDWTLLKKRPTKG